MHHPASYRDPSGFVFEKDGIFYRQVNRVFKDDFDYFISSGCYEKLVTKNLLLPHTTVSKNEAPQEDAYLVLRPEQIPFISYPYEWSFDMLRDAALLTLRVLRVSLDYGMVLKDASPYNVQWYKGGFIFMDTLSFEKYKEEPWIAYRQFCENFLSPLLLAHYHRQSMSSLALAYPEGIPLSVTRSFLPNRSRFSLHVYLHIFLQASVSAKQKNVQQKTLRLPKKRLLNLVTSLELLINKLKSPAPVSPWSDYYEEATQRKDYLAHKEKIVRTWINESGQIENAIDLGANTGLFSRILAGRNTPVIAVDADPYCINQLYLEIKKQKEKNIQPLVMDLVTPSSALGFNNQERSSFSNRTHADLALALALVHHLAIGRNIPLDMIASFFHSLGKRLIVEFVPKEDEKVQQMLAAKKDIYTNYDATRFEEAFKKYFSLAAKEPVAGSGRILYLFTA